MANGESSTSADIPQNTLVVTHSDDVLPANDKISCSEEVKKTLKVHPATFYEPFCSTLSKNWMRSPIRGLMSLESTPGLLSLLAGKPNTTTFPIKSISLQVRSPTPPFEETTLNIEGDRLTEALQYGHTDGHKDLTSFLMNMQSEFHHRPRDASWRTSVGSGSQDLITKAFHVLTNPGDVCLVEAPTYAGVIPNLRSCGAVCVEVPVDGRGIVSSELRRILENWPEGKMMPKYLYTVPYGCNPTGATATNERRREVLALARKYNFLIMEDDPYYLLYYGDEARPDSYFALEAQDGHETGIVIRFDSLSKVVSSGLRIGFATGPAPILQLMDLETASVNLQPNSVAQSIVYALLSHWGVQGFKDNCHTISQYYKERRDVFEAALNKHLKGMIEYTSPVAGMFLWFKLLIPPPADDPTASEGDSSTLIRTKAFEAGVLALPGTSFFVNGRRSAYVRASFSMLNDEDTDEAVRRLSVVVKQARGEI